MLNIAVIMGRLTADPELRTTNNNIPVCTVTVAVDRNYQREGQERQTDFLTVVAWRQTAEFIAKHFRKGKMIAVQGSIQTRKYEDRNGNKRTAVEIVADNVSFCGSKEQGEPPKTSYSAPQSRNGTHITAEQFEAVYNMEEDDGESLPF